MRSIVRGTNLGSTRNMNVLCADRLYTPLQEIRKPLLFIENGRISEVSSRAQREIPNSAKIFDLTTDVPGAILAPGFIDIHMHGGAGLDVMRASSAELPRLHKFLVAHGVTGYFPTTVAAPLDQTCAALARLADAIEAGQTSSNGDAAAPLGIHLEDRFSATSGAAYILRNISSSPP